MLRIVAWMLALLLLVAGSCTADRSNPVAPSWSEPGHVISDGAHEGNEHFYFLPSLVPQPSLAGTFDGSLAPEVQICAWNGSACTAMLAFFTTEAGYGSESIRVDQTEEHYVVNWHTAEILDTYPRAEDEVFRIRVLAQGQELGHADLAVVASGKDLKNVNTDEYVPLKDGRTLAIKFRIEEGAIVEGPAFEHVSAGFFHSCAVASNGDGYCWGWGGRGQLGSPAGSSADARLVSGGHKWQAIEVGHLHSCGLADDGRVYCWGHNGQGQLGIGAIDFQPHDTPELVAGGLTFRSLASLTGGTYHSCGVTIDSEMFCWGLNTGGQLGTGSVTGFESSPARVGGTQTFDGPAGGGGYVTCARASGEVFCWGANGAGQLGRGYYDSSPHPTPVAVLGGNVFAGVTVGGNHVCGNTPAGEAYCWGSDSRGQIGLGGSSSGHPVTVPSPVVRGHSFDRLSAGQLHTCGVRSDGTGVCWGYNDHGQLGRGFSSGSADALPTPEPITGGLDLGRIAAGSRHSCGTTIGGEVYCWGRNSDFQSGGSSRANVLVPELVELYTLP